MAHRIYENKKIFEGKTIRKSYLLINGKILEFSVKLKFS
jgi:hypothetical protein